MMGVIDMRKEKDPYLATRQDFRAGDWHHRLLSARRDGDRSSLLRQERAVDAQAGQSAGSSHRSRHPSRRTHPRVCAAENQDGDYRTGTGFEGTGGGDAAAHAPYSAKTKCRSSWMPPMPWVQPTATFCRWTARRRTPSTIAAGKTLPPRNPGRVEGSARLTGPEHKLMAALNRTTHK